MGLQAILEAIHMTGETQVREIEATTQARVKEILAEARAKSKRTREEACAAAAAPAAVVRARALHEARFEALYVKLLAQIPQQRRRASVHRNLLVLSPL